MPCKTTIFSSSKSVRIVDPSCPEDNPPIPPFSDRITDRLNRVMYEKKKNNQIEPERTLDPIFENQLEISILFMGLRWVRMITRSGVYYSSLVQEFYTNITQKNNKDLIN